MEERTFRIVVHQLIDYIVAQLVRLGLVVLDFAILKLDLCSAKVFVSVEKNRNTMFILFHTELVVRKV